MFYFDSSTVVFLQSLGHKLFTVGCGAYYLVCGHCAPRKLMNYVQFIHWILSLVKSTAKRKPALHSRKLLAINTTKVVRKR